MNQMQPSPEQIVSTLRKLRSDPSLETLAQETELVVQDLQDHQAELEHENRELRETKEALEASRVRYAELFDFAPIGYLTFDRAGLVLEANLTAAALLTIERSALIGKPLGAVVTIDDATSFNAHVGAAFGEAPCCAVHDMTIKTPSGRTMTLEVTSVRSTDAQGRPLEQCRATLVDVTARRRDAAMLALLSNAGELLASSLDHTTNIASVERLVVPLLADACFVDVADEAGQLRRLSIVSSDPSQQALVTLLERPLLRPHESTPQARVMDRIESCLLIGECAIEAVPAELLEACGKPASALVVPLVTRGTVHGALTLLMLRSGRVHERDDIRNAAALARRVANAVDNANLYRHAQHAIRAREEILSTVSHDLRNSLSSIVMNTTLMLSGAPAQERRRDHRRLEMLHRAATRMQRMTDDLIDLCAIEAGHLTIDAARWNVDEILQEVQAALTALAREKDHQLEIRLIGKKTWVACDRDRVLQIFANLVGNAVKYTPKGGHITVAAQCFSSVVRLSVHDDGPGMDDLELKHLFDRYWRAEHRRKTSKGLGIGLDICKGLVESQGGAIWVESKKGEGSTFFFTLPHADHAPERSKRPNQPLTVLVVDDNEQICNVIDDSLSEKGCRVITAVDGVAALEVLQSDVPLDLILVDLEMPRLDGRSLVAQLVANPAIRRVPILFMSCGRMSENEARVLGAEGFLHKPFDASRLFELVPGFGVEERQRRATS